MRADEPDREPGSAVPRRVALGDLAAWVGYLRDIGVRELHVPQVPPQPRPPAEPAHPSRAPRLRPSPPVALEPGLGAAPVADPAARLLEIREELGDCTRCKLHEGRTNIVFGVGSPGADLMFVGEGPGEQEDLRGEPFVGRAGQKLDEMIKAIGFRRADVYIANIVKCRPPGNRDPEGDEIEACSRFLAAQIAAIRPRVIVTLGGPASKTLLGTTVGITRLRGTWQSYRGVPVMPTFHPAYLLRNYTKQTRTQIWEDLQAARARCQEG
jgi:uracil-DNA glycosylase family 4